MRRVLEAPGREEEPAGEQIVQEDDAAPKSSVNNMGQEEDIFSPAESLPPLARYQSEFQGRHMLNPLIRIRQMDEQAPFAAYRTRRPSRLRWPLLVVAASAVVVLMAAGTN
jgi:hypothetical protein